MKNSTKRFCGVLIAICIASILLISAAGVYTGNDTSIDADSYIDDIGSTLLDSSEVELLSEGKSFTQVDLNNNFSNYADENSTVDLPSPLASGDDIYDYANVVGVVLDYDTNIPIADATVMVGGRLTVTTDKDGRFQIKNMPNGTYDWTVTADGYHGSFYLNYPVDGSDGANIFTFCADKNDSLEFDRNDICKGEQAEPPTHEGFSHISTYSMSSIPSIKSSVKVYYGGKTMTLDREEYIYTVLSSEVYSVSWYRNFNLSDDQISHFYVAQAVAANTFLEYALSVYSNHSKEDYDVCADQCCQVYDRAKITQAAINATAQIFHDKLGYDAAAIALYHPNSRTYDYIYGAFFSSCFGEGTWTHKNQPALIGKACTDLTSGARSNHQYGLCQMGAAWLAKNDYLASEIVGYYYTDTQNCFCRLA
ncbi:MAG: hypothetical protein HFF18_06320 [Oscillospiraceae bacterium]|nr:hypothetical protein [Oscillospiraceae bacterium]